tara:strand:- start:74 stop:508 length:435 start_codon:yes stop_codon:yes gene_type:complete
MKKSINLVYHTKHWYSLKLDFDINILRNCKPPYEGNSFDELKKYLIQNVFEDILGHVTVNYKWLEENENILKSCNLKNGHTLYDELDLDHIIYQDQPYEGEYSSLYKSASGKWSENFVTHEWTESVDLEEPHWDERPGFENPGK